MPALRFWNRKIHLLSNSSAEYSLVLVDKVLSSIFLFEFKIVGVENAAGEYGYGDGEL